jgi:nicotinate phosphoribosyltransferase
MKAYKRAYCPSDDLLEAYRLIFPLEISPWDDYFPRMAQTDFLSGFYENISTKTYFIRKAPFGGSYAVMGGLIGFLRTLQDFEFDSEVCKSLTDMGYRADFVEFLKKRNNINVRVYAIPEGGLFFPNEPAIVMEGCLGDIRFAEGMLLKQVNFPSLSATKWSRVIQQAHPGAAMEFSRRRAQDDLRTSLMAYLMGAAVSSNAEIRRGANIPITGTMGHEYIQSIGDQFRAFDTWLEHNPDRPILLVDTIDTLSSGIPDAIKAFEKHKERIVNAGGMPGVRLDSGDLAYLTIESQILFNTHQMHNIKVYETNDLDEYKTSTIKRQIWENSPNEIFARSTLEKVVWAYGTVPGTCADQSSIGGVSKLTSVEQDGTMFEVIKLARDNPIKTSIPGENRSFWIVDSENEKILACGICPYNVDLNDISEIIHQDDSSKRYAIDRAEYTVIPRQELVFEHGDIKTETVIPKIRNYHQKQLSKLHWTSKRLEKPHAIKVGLEESLFITRQKMIKNGLLINKP